MLSGIGDLFPGLPLPCECVPLFDLRTEFMANGERGPSLSGLTERLERVNAAETWSTGSTLWLARRARSSGAERRNP